MDLDYPKGVSRGKFWKAFIINNINKIDPKYRNIICLYSKIILNTGSVNSHQVHNLWITVKRI